MANKILSTGIPYKTLPESYIRPENERPNLSQVSDCENVPVIDLGAKDRTQTIHQVFNACKNYGFFQVRLHTSEPFHSFTTTSACVVGGSLMLISIHFCFFFFVFYIYIYFLKICR